jgi:hypothetical protein
MSEASTKPISVFRRRGVKVAVFENRVGQNVWHKVSVQKIYRDDQEQWKTTTSLGRDDLPIARLLLGKAWEFILDQEAADAKTNE